jgi:hypothetical protein
MNPSWLTGMMPESMYKHEHPAHLEEARRDTEEMIKEHLSRVSERAPAAEENPSPDKPATDSPDKR